jgi:hypothetical protein
VTVHKKILWVLRWTRTSFQFPLIPGASPALGRREPKLLDLGKRAPSDAAVRWLPLVPATTGC